ncbi:MAG: hypothetical protein ACOX9R_08155 [Armatimonadota bacterium]|jgi:hypothetical protein
MYFLTRFCGLLFLALAAGVVVMSIVDSAPEFANVADRLGDEPISSSVKFNIGFQIVFDVVAVAVFALIGWFLWTSEIQQTWAVVTTFVLLVGSIVIRVEPLLPMNVARHSPGLAFWGALVIDDYYPAPPPGEGRGRNVTTFPVDQYYRIAVTEPNLPGDQMHPDKSVALNFNRAPQALGTFQAAGRQGVQIVGKLAGTRTILDYDFQRDVYSVPHMMVLEVDQVGARDRAQ